MDHQSLHTSSNRSSVYLPTVAILIAARNEEHNISACLDALLKSDYSKEKMEILVGDDGSSDRTPEIIDNYCRKFSFIRSIPILHDHNKPSGKINVLAQLARSGTSEILLITDADVEVPSTWVKQMVMELAKGFSLVSGPTAVRHSNLFSSLQNADWLYNFYIRVISEKVGISLGVSGTNMAILENVYRSVGGFEAFSGSITEDYDLFRSVIRSGYKCKTCNELSVLALTIPERTFAFLLLQQKRWLNSLPHMSLANLSGVMVQNLLLVWVIALFLIFKEPLILLIIAIKWVVEIVILLLAYKKFKQKNSIAIYLYTPYASACMPIFLLSWMFSKKNTWKGRKYNKKNSISQ
jgi:cellulose synthase/poly-beta-1,6-N-acetylglucosamine synthase-like glycosyltransferase